MQKRIGELLAERRQAMGASLADVEGATLIRSAYIDAVEKGNYDLIPGRIYVKLYVKSYASFLGMDPQQAAKILETEMAMLDGDAFESGHTHDGAISERRALQRGRIEQKRRQAARKRAMTAIFVIVGIVAIVLIALFLSGGLLGGKVDKSADVQGITVTEPSGTDAGIQEPSTADNLGLSEPEHKLRVDFSDDCWIRAYADGVKAYEGIWREGSFIEIEANQGIWIRFGNAGAASLNYNGEELGSPGLARKVMDVSFPAGYQPF